MRDGQLNACIIYRICFYSPFVVLFIGLICIFIIILSVSVMLSSSRFDDKYKICGNFFRCFFLYRFVFQAIQKWMRFWQIYRLLRSTMRFIFHFNLICRNQKSSFINLRALTWRELKKTENHYKSHICRVKFNENDTFCNAPERSSGCTHKNGEQICFKWFSLTWTKFVFIKCTHNDDTAFTYNNN